jgi:hypothetical protein
MLCSSWTYTLLWWVFAACLYYVTLRIAECRAARRPMPALDDVGFEYTPCIPGLTRVCDYIGVLGTVWMLLVIAFGSGAQRELIRAMLDYHALGNVFSTSLHSVTILPSADFRESTVPLMGGSADKLMSNHTFNFGMFLRCLSLVHGLSWPWWLIPALVLLYSWSMLCTRGHYSVDIVLAWWAIAVLMKVNPSLVEPLL